MIAVPGFDDFVAIVAPFPRQGTVVEGWLSRIRAVDAVFRDRKRIYLNFDEALKPQGGPIAERHGADVLEYRIQPASASHQAFVRGVIAAARLVYVHTVHLARYVLPYYPSGKIVTDIHGIVPEEEAMLGRPETGAFYAVVERFVLMNSVLVVVVSDAMRRHLVAKYPGCAAEFVVMPVIEKYPQALADRVARPDSEKPRVIYAGAAQVWQNIDLMLDVCRSSIAYFDYRFVSHDHEQIRQKAQALGIANAIAFGVSPKEKMAAIYLNADYGFVLRDDVSVNRVACPTKLSEYMQFGVIPVVKSPEIGDLAAEGYVYVTHDELAAGVVPEGKIADDLRQHNKAVIDRIAGRFDSAAGRIRALTLPNREGQDRFLGLLAGSRYLIFPNCADFYVFSAQVRYGRVEVVAEYSRIDIALAGSSRARLFRFVPIVADARIAIRKLTIEHQPSDEPASIKSVNIDGSLIDGACAFRKESPHIGIETTVEIDAIRFIAEVEFIAVGPGAIAGMATDRAPPIEIEMIQSGRARLSQVEPAFTRTS